MPRALPSPFTVGVGLILIGCPVGTELITKSPCCTLAITPIFSVVLMDATKDVTSLNPGATVLPLIFNGRVKSIC